VARAAIRLPATTRYVGKGERFDRLHHLARCALARIGLPSLRHFVAS
jgi:hypothetical protein